MKLTNWRSFSPHSTYERSLDQFFNDRYRNLLGMTNEFSPAVNTAERKDSYKIELATPGLKKDDFDITVNNGVLTINSNRSIEKERDEDRYATNEFNYTSFSRSFTLPKDVDDEHINATYENGVLKITLPREVEPEENDSIRKITIK